MKTREGFVSNSSSTSFCIMGVSLPDGTDRWELEDKLSGVGLRVEAGCNEGDDSVYVGLWPDDMKEEETLSAFMKRIRKNLEAKGLGDGESLGWITDGGYNG